MNELQMAKNLIGSVMLISLIGSLAVAFIGYKFAEITYKRAHQKTKKRKVVKPQYEVIYNIDSKNKTLQEVQAEKRKMWEVLANV